MRFLPALLLAATLPSLSQPPRAPELFVAAGVLRAAGDEGSLGTAPAFGATATLPFSHRWAIDIQAITSRSGYSSAFQERRVLFSPGLQYRRGDSRAYWFLAFGPGYQHDDDPSSRLTLHWRTGAVFQPASRLLLRGEFFSVHRYVLPSVGAAVSLGFRLGR